MPKTTPSPPIERGIKTGRRENPAINGPRDKTVCFMLSEAERVDVDRLAFCLNLTRSGFLAKVIATFVDASGDTDKAKEAEHELRSYLGHCRKEAKRRGDLAAASIPNPTEQKP
jgi:hypothetical protein